MYDTDSLDRALELANTFTPALPIIVVRYQRKARRRRRV